jgi:dsDNA-specific endonuclease/ATPase MutS2
MTSMFTVKNQRQKSKLNPRKPRQEIKADIHQIEDRKQLINESRSWFFDKIKKIDKPVARIIESPRYQKQER